MAESFADFICCDGGVGPHCARKARLGCDGCTHTVFTHVAAAFVESAGTAEDGFGALIQASAAYMDIRGWGTVESRIMVGVDGPGAFEAEGLKHAFVIVDGQRVVSTEVSELIEDVNSTCWSSLVWVSNLVLLTYVPNDSLCHGLDDYVTGFDDGRVRDDAVRHGVRGYVGDVVSDMGHVGYRL
jgi:hypothetical protein